MTCLISLCKSVQPRGYGEHTYTRWVMVALAGSAPWVRGTLTRKYSLFRFTRFSPVGTGNTS